jgi:chromosome segregation ATPase
MESGLESFDLLEKKTQELGRRYQEVLAERNNLQQKLEEQALRLTELENRVGSQADLLQAVDNKMVDLLGEIDKYLPPDTQDSGSAQVLPGMHGS